MTGSLTTRQINTEANNSEGTKDLGGMWQKTTLPCLRVKLVGAPGIPAEVNLLEEAVPSIENKSLEFQSVSTKYQQE